MLKRSYVGLTGFESEAQVLAIRKAIPKDRTLMVGVGLRGDPVKWSPDQWPNRCPPWRKMREIFTFAPYGNILNIVHFTPLPGCPLGEHMCFAHEAGGSNTHGIQLNAPWPAIEDLFLYRSKFGRAVITIGVQKESLEAVGSDPKRIAERLKDYDGIADYVLVDPSAGYGQDLKVDFTLRCLTEIRAHAPNIGLVVAGGLHAGNADEKLTPILKHFEVSTDLEGRVRTPPPDDHLILTEATRSVQTIDALLRKFEAQRKPQLVN